MFSYHIHLASSCCRRFTHVPKPFFVVAVVVLPTVNNSDQHFQKNEEAPPSNFVPFGCCVGSSVHWLWTGSTRHCLLFHVATSKRDKLFFSFIAYNLISFPAWTKPTDISISLHCDSTAGMNFVSSICWTIPT